MGFRKVLKQAQWGWRKGGWDKGGEHRQREDGIKIRRGR